MNAGRAFLIFNFLLLCLLTRATAQPAHPEAFKILTVADGLPQSFISGLVQDSTGFVWIGTKDGLARYDGRRFKLFRHSHGDTATLANNRISSLYLDRQQGLWIAYETGDVDVLNTTTEALFHFTGDPVFKPTFFKLKAGQSMAEDGQGNVWLLGAAGGLFRCSISEHTLRYFSEGALGLEHDKIVSIAAQKDHLLLITDTAMVLLNERGVQTGSVSYSASPIHLYDPARPWKICRVEIRSGGDIVILDDDRLLLYSSERKSFTALPLPKAEMATTLSMTQDEKGDVYFEHGRSIYKLSLQDELVLWKPRTDSKAQETAAMLVDHSGVLWVGANGNGLRLFDLRLTRLAGLAYERNFPADVLHRLLLVPEPEIKRSLFWEMNPYGFRWAGNQNGTLWLFSGGQNETAHPQIYLYSKGHISLLPWHYTDTYARHVSVNSMAYSKSGKLWGVDFFLRPVYFDTALHTATVLPSPFISPDAITTAYAVNSLVIDGEDTFWISTALNGLYCYDKRSARTIHYTADGTPGALPINQLMNMINDPANPGIMWIGSLGGGLIRFDKNTGRCRSFTTKDGLPNNTVYAVVADDQGLLWCSSNKGIFAFRPTTGAVKSFTSKDGLRGDEFNRYHFLKLPDGRLAFGGVEGFTVFSPATLTEDRFDPPIALTGISINNAPAGFGTAGSPFSQAINNMPQIVLPHYQNFLTLEFAALEFNITEKLQYRHMLEGVDASWVNTGNENTATYTNLPPGNYLFKVNATNISGDWSPHIKTLRIIIRPPFWKTWQFFGICLLALTCSIFLLVRRKINAVRKEEQQKLRSEQEASELKAQALRAQMNPHFIFNCLNSIKALIQEDNRQAVIYLTSFSKLIRSQLNNAEREISLYEELETCRLYTRMESLRFGDKISCVFNVDKQVDIHSLPVPSLILQPFIENAIWHGILPKGGGTVAVSVTGHGGVVCCAVEDDGIGREMSRRNKSRTSDTYESKGMKLALNRIALYNAMHGPGGSIAIADKKDGAGNAAGTLVTVTFKKEEK